MDKFGNYIYQDNLGIGAYIYHGMNAWANDDPEKQNVDFHNTTSRIVHYPVTWYGICDYLCPETPTYEITGFMPKGTRIDIHLKNLWGAKVIIKADDEVINEQITPNTGEVEGCIKLVHSYPIAIEAYRSPYVISADIPDGTSKITITAEYVPEHDGWAVGIGLIEIVYPEEYAVTNYYYETTYSAYLEGERDHTFSQKDNSILISWGAVNFEDLRAKGLNSQKIVLNSEDMSWSSPQPELIIERGSSAEVFQQGENLSRFNEPSHVVIRHENPTFTAAFWEDILAYYEDIYSMCEEHGFSVVASWDWCRVGNFHQSQNARIINIPETREFDIYEHFIWEFFHVHDIYSIRHQMEFSVYHLLL